MKLKRMLTIVLAGALAFAPQASAVVHQLTPDEMQLIATAQYFPKNTLEVCRLVWNCYGELGMSRIVKRLRDEGVQEGDMFFRASWLVCLSLTRREDPNLAKYPDEPTTEWLKRLVSPYFGNYSDAQKTNCLQCLFFVRANRSVVDSLGGKLCALTREEWEHPENWENLEENHPIQAFMKLAEVMCFACKSGDELIRMRESLECSGEE